MKLKTGLFNLISNVILIEEENSGGHKFHFRIDMKNTSSFQQLETHTREAYRNYTLIIFSAGRMNSGKKKL